METTTESFKDWALVELFGHSRIVGYVTEQSIGGGAFLRVDVHDAEGNPKFTRFFGHGAVYGISPISKDLALKLSANQDMAPVHRYELPAPSEVKPVTAQVVEQDEF